MKTIMILTLLLSTQAFAAAKVLVQSSTSVYFAPPADRGVYSTQITTDGTIQYVDNKMQVTKVAKLSARALAKLKNQIESLEESALQGQEGPRCTDFPSTKKEVIKADGQAVIIKQMIACNEKEMLTALELISVIEGAEKLTETLK